MIRVSKAADVPASLLAENCSNYNGQDVQEALVADQHEKCYLCEQKTTKSFQIEHHKAKAAGYFPHLEFAWSNLFLACGYCNGRKPNDYDILDPVANDIENIISHRLDLGQKSVILSNLRTGTQELYTVCLLERLFNGKNGLRDKKGEMLFKDLSIEIIFFMSLLNAYQNTPSAENKQKVIDSLLITKEFLAFKYWIIKDNPTLLNDFKDYMVWNKPISID